MLYCKTYKSHKSKWYNSHHATEFRLALCFLSVDANLQSIPLSSISAYVKQELPEVQTRIFIMFADQKDKKYAPDGFSLFLAKWQPDLIAVSILSPQWRFIKKYLTTIKKYLPKVPILAGGYHPIFSQDETLSHPSIDFLCNGDGEIPTVNLIKFLRGETKGPVQGICEKLITNEIFCSEPTQITDFNSLPLPDYSLYDYNGKFHIYSIFYRSKKRVLPIMTGRGCLFHCTYCSNSSLYRIWKDKKRFIRKYPIPKIINQIKYLKDKYDMEFVEFWDELFYNDLDYILKFFKEYKKHIGLPFLTTSRVELMSENVCEQAADAGCFAVYFGIESGDEHYRKKMLRRNMTNRQIIDAAENCKKTGINRIVFNLVGMPFETKENMLNTLALTKKIKPEYMPFIYMGTLTTHRTIRYCQGK